MSHNSASIKVEHHLRCVLFKAPSSALGQEASSQIRYFISLSVKPPGASGHTLKAICTVCFYQFSCCNFLDPLPESPAPTPELVGESITDAALHSLAGGEMADRMSDIF